MKHPIPVICFFAGVCLLLTLAATPGAQAQGIEAEGLGDSQNTGRAAGAIIQPFDQVDIRVRREPQLSDIYNVSPAGSINF
ncbi:MAG: hypothetical protein KC931_25125, partial [Candidatus Omnitrophica bacterium]|nr:hypothetical protein [Candidatus Omnitrophota bacterium]